MIAQSGVAAGVWFAATTLARSSTPLRTVTSRLLVLITIVAKVCGLSRTKVFSWSRKPTPGKNPDSIIPRARPAFFSAM